MDKIEPLPEKLRTHPSFAQSTAIIGYLKGQDSLDTVMVMLFEFQRMLQKERREDRKQQRIDKEIALASKQRKLGMEREKIDRMKAEADEKFENLMTSADAAMIMGIISGLIQMVSAIKLDMVLEKHGADSTAIEVRYQQLISRLDSEKKAISGGGENKSTSEKKGSR